LPNTAKSPRKISMSAETTTLAGIYRLQRDELKIYFDAAADRAANFASNDGSESRLAHRERKEPVTPNRAGDDCARH
jgi:hypothetical protein